MCAKRHKNKTDCVQEFFQLLIRELFLPDYGMFEFLEETREYWFSPAALDIGVSKHDFKMVGIVLGLVCSLPAGTKA